jgi:hypothetical protein
MSPKPASTLPECAQSETCGAEFAVLKTELGNLDRRLTEGLASVERRFDERFASLESYLRVDYGKTLELRIGSLEHDVAGLKKFRDDIMKKLFMAMGAFAVLMFILEAVIIPIAIKAIVMKP